MPFPRLSIVLISILLLGEAALALWRHAPIPVSTAPVFSFPPAAAQIRPCRALKCGLPLASFLAAAKDTP
jgi:hypothetical protein